LSFGVVHDTLTDPFGSPTATTLVGASGNPLVFTGVTALEGADGGPLPIELLAVTVKVYGVPLVKFVTVQGDVAQDWKPPEGDVLIE